MAKIYYLSAKDVAQILNVSLSTAYKGIKDGVMPAIRHYLDESQRQCSRKCTLG